MRLFRATNLVALILCFCIVVFGAFVRLSDAGLGCPDWPGCYGQLTVPQAAHEVARAQAQFPARPVEAPKAWKEMIHRYLATTLGSLIVALLVLALALRLPTRLPLLLFGLVLFQGALGALTVLWKLTPWIVTGHLLGGMTTLALLAWLYLSNPQRAMADAPPEPERAHRSERQVWFELERAPAPDAPSMAAPRGTRRFAAILLALLAAQIFLGGWTSSNYAALGCPDFPLCQGQVWPDTDVGAAFTPSRDPTINYEHGVLDARARTTIHLFHRVGALVVSIAAWALGLALLLAGRAGPWRPLGVALLAAVSLQVALGIGMVHWQFPLGLAVSHNAGAALLLLVLVALNFHARRADLV
jgi:cytochrome c oxidase assembly protein subunit 15